MKFKLKEIKRANLNKVDCLFYSSNEVASYINSGSRDILKTMVLYWRLFFLLVLVYLYLTDVIEKSLFFAVILGIIFFQGIPWLYKKMKSKESTIKELG